MSKVAGVYLPRYELFALQQFFVFLMCQSQLNISCNFTRLCIKWDSELLVAHAAVGTNTQQTLSGSISITSALTSSHMTTLCRKLSKSSLLFHVITARPWLSHWPPPSPSPSTHLQQSLIDSGWTVSGFPSSNASCECFSFVLLFEQLSAPASFSTSNNISGSRLSPWPVLLLLHTLNALCCCCLKAQAEIRPAESIGMLPIHFKFCRVVSHSEFLIWIYYQQVLL